MRGCVHTVAGMVVRRRHTFEIELDDGVEMRCRYDAERDVVAFANDGYKHAAEVFHHGTPAEAYRSSMRLSWDEFERMIQRWDA